LPVILRTLFRPLDGLTVALCLSLLALNMLDAFATLRHLAHGAEELNPLMAAALRFGARPFLLIKHGLASVGILALLAHGGPRAARVALCVLVPIYLALGAYQVGLFFAM
jgi:hypothetical protein